MRTDDSSGIGIVVGFIIFMVLMIFMFPYMAGAVIGLAIFYVLFYFFKATLRRLEVALLQLDADERSPHTQCRYTGCPASHERI